MAAALALPPEPPAPPARAARFTADEFLAMLETGVLGDRKLELADGEIVEVPLPGWTHAELQARLILLLSAAISAEQVMLGELNVRLTPARVRDLDAALVHRAHRKPGPAAPEAIALAIEIADSTLATDLHAKAAEYAQAGIPAYWVIDPAAEVVHVHAEPGPAGYAARHVIRFEEPLAVPGGGAITIGRLAAA